ncbi:MAG: heme lyase CcmF/NrfE family subunit [Alphaproteobacteria bacterium]|nr:heme lyase CcmF/NrfE family subunit [Alphaproteobacteria bacterium]MCY4318066.1 heme lyase CcmF/NrfE family subunit [Alphaproteobacteria bacterium]
MTAELGHFALTLALGLALLQATLPLYGASRGQTALMELARHTAFGQFVFTAIAFAALTRTYLVSDFSVAVVVQNSHSLKPLLYRLTGVWGNHEGSLLLWILILTLFGAMVSLFGSSLRETFRARVLAVQAMVGAGFLAFTLLTSNPFQRVWPPPLDGAGLNPLLQDPGLAFHPPLLYFGYVGLSVAFSFAVAALLEGRVDRAWARWVRPWTLAAWAGLTAGIALGSWWAYYELGWGGFWFWDPVENASFMPWLAATALLHSAIAAERREALRSWTVLLAIIAFSLSLLGAFLVRSGVLTSVHAFATDPERGIFILLLLGIATGGALALYAWRAPAFAAGSPFRPVSREGALLLNNLVLATACATVLLGTLYPLFLDALDAGKVSVGPPYFTATFVPLIAPALVAMAIGPMLAWKRGDLAGALGRLWAAALGAALAAGAALAYGETLAALGLGAAAWIGLGALVEWAERLRLGRAPAIEVWRRARGVPRAAWGAGLAHLGVAIVVAGITASQCFQSELILAMKPGDSAQIAGYTIRYDGTAQVEGANYHADRATLAVLRDDTPVAILTPERRFYPVESQHTTEAAIRTTFLADLYAVIGEDDPEAGRTVRLYHNPLVPWIWIGAIVMALGALASLTDRRLRLTMPVRRRQAAEA